MSVGEQVFDFIIREGAVCFQAEHGQTALRVVAADDLAVKLHRPRSALGTLAAGIPAGEQLVARQQFGGNFPCICLNLPAEVIGGQFPTLDACQFLFPFARHGDIGNTHRLHDRVEGKPFFGGDKRLLAAFHIAALEKRFDDGRTGGGRADAAILHSLPQCVVLYLLASRFHRGQQSGFGMLRLGFGCHYILDSACHPYVNKMAAEGVIPHIVLEKEFDRVLMEETGKDPDHYYPACGIMPKMEYARVIHRAIPLVKTINIYISVRMMKILTNFMVCDDHGRKRRILGKLLRLGGESIGSVIEHFMTAEAVEQAKAPMPELERLYREAVPEAVEYLGELYTLREGAYHLSKRWDRTYNG